MKKSILTILVLMVALLVFPSQSYAAWWNPLSWFSKNQHIEEQEQSQNTTSSGTVSEPKNIITPVNNSQPSNAKTIEDLRAEVTTLKASLDNLYTAHNNLVDSHNELLKYVNATISSGKNAGTAVNNSNLETKFTNLEKKLDDVCAQIFSSILFGPKCPSSQFIIKDTLEGRIKKLEGGY